MPSATRDSIDTISDVEYRESAMRQFTIVAQTVFVTAVLGFASAAIVLLTPENDETLGVGSNARRSPFHHAFSDLNRV